MESSVQATGKKEGITLGFFRFPNNVFEVYMGPLTVFFQAYIDSLTVFEAYMF